MRIKMYYIIYKIYYTIQWEIQEVAVIAELEK